MTTVSHARTIARYRMWADRLTFDAVAALPPGEATKERPTLFKTMVGTLNHNYVIDLIWQAHLEGREHGFTARNVVLHPELSDLWQAQQAVNRWYIDWSERQSQASLDEIVNFTFIGGEKSSMSRGDILLHVVNHATYHRDRSERRVGGHAGQGHSASPLHCRSNAGALSQLSLDLAVARRGRRTGARGCGLAIRRRRIGRRIEAHHLGLRVLGPHVRRHVGSGRADRDATGGDGEDEKQGHDISFLC
jgi:uncharacterized damage-inducible protein DinB